MNVDYSTVTELAGTRASRAQIERACTRYYFAATFCQDKDVLEVACGAGQGLGYLAEKARRVVGLDIDEGILVDTRRTYRGRPNIEIVRGDAQSLPFPAGHFDVVILYEALYYLPDPNAFAAEAARVLRAGGTLIICTANKDLPDFNPSPYSHRYFGVPELRALLVPLGFAVKTYVSTPVNSEDIGAWVLRTVKSAAVRLHLIPKTMRGKLLLKRLLFGPLVTLPAEITGTTGPYCAPVPIASDRPCLDYAVLFCVGQRGKVPS